MQESLAPFQSLTKMNCERMISTGSEFLNVKNNQVISLAVFCISYNNIFVPMI